MLSDADKVYANFGDLNIVASVNKNIEVYNLQGLKVLSSEVVAGYNSFKVEKGIYIVKIADKIHKVYVR